MIVKLDCTWRKMIGVSEVDLTLVRKLRSHTCSRPRRKAKPLLDHPVSLMKPVKTADGVAWTGAQAASAMIVATTVEILIRAKVAVIRSRMRTRKI
jgi:hypothetical protein